MTSLAPILREDGAHLAKWHQEMGVLLAIQPQDWTADTYRTFDSLIVGIFMSFPVTHLLGAVPNKELQTVAFWKALAGEPNRALIQPHVEHPRLIHSAGWWDDAKAEVLRFEWVRWP